MKLNRLTLTNVRAFEQAEFEFHPGMNLLVGINGAGKSTVLDALRIMLSQTLPEFTAATKRIAIPFEKDDIAVGQGALTANLEFEAAGVAFEHLVHLPREDHVVDEIREGQVRDQTYELVEHNVLTPNQSRILKPLRKKREQPLAVHFSTRRSLPIMKSPGKSETAKNQASAFVHALDNDRGLHIYELAQWWLVQEALSTEKPELARYLTVLNDALSVFLDNCTNLRAVREPEETLLIDKEGATLDVRQLSDGERSVLALVLDVARRLAKVNPDLENPLEKGKAVVLIDELDLHLHPSWQRTIVNKLTRTFPKCQFIATTHSPQILGEVSPENITILEYGEAPYHPLQSLGMDSNWILQFLMGDTDRNRTISQKLDSISELIEEDKYVQAQSEIDVLRDDIGDFPELVRLQARLERLQILGV
ncbi:MAG: AAA family ATPase [Anaerolineae bacterium]|nr:AAA family ATPase [Anaerolineae bacterium]